MNSDKLRLDKYLWAIRIFKTRSQSATAIENGKVKINGAPVKASRTVSPGDRFDIRTEARKWTIEVTALIHNRVSYEESLKYYADLTSEEDKAYQQRVNTSFYTGKRLSKTGRPTKKQRRDLNDLLNDAED